MRIFLSVLLLSLAIISCSPNTTTQSNNTSPVTNSDEGAKFKFNSLAPLKVTDESGTPLANAQVLIGSKLDTPFTQNFINTNGNGEFAAPAAWTTPQPVTIQALGFIRTSFMQQLPNGQQFVLHKTDDAAKAEIRGQTTGFGDLPKTDQLHIAVSFPTPMMSNLFLLNVSSLISDEDDILSVAGQKMAIPSNFTIPKQKQSYIIPITIDKPVYRMKITSDTKDMVGLHGQFPFKKVVGELRGGKSFFDILNEVQFLSVGTAPVIAIDGLDIPVNQIALTSQVAVQAPSFAQDRTMFAIAAQQSGTHAYPTDIKLLNSNEQLGLAVASANTALVYTILGKKRTLPNGKPDLAPDMSIAVQKPGITPTFLETIPQPQIQQNKLTATPPQAQKGLSGLATYAAISHVEITQQQDLYQEKKTRDWEVYAPEWVSAVQLPEWPHAVDSLTGVHRLEFFYLANSQGATINNVGPEMFGVSTHASHNSIDY